MTQTRYLVALLFILSSCTNVWADSPEKYRKYLDGTKLPYHLDAKGFQRSVSIFYNQGYPIRSEAEIMNAVLAEIDLLFQADGLKPNSESARDLESLKAAAKNFPDNLLFYAASQGLVNCAQTDGLTFLSEAKHKAQRPEHSVGIGVQFVRVPRHGLVIAHAAPGGAADLAGLSRGDRVLRVDDIILADINLQYEPDGLRGEPGTPVVLVGKRENGEDFRYVVKRAPLSTPEPQPNHRLLADDILYLSPGTLRQQDLSEVRELLSKAEGVCLDLRGVSIDGSKYEEVRRLLGLFLSKDTLLTTLAARDGRTWEIKTEDSGDLEIPLVVLVDRFTGFNTEIAVAALQDLKRATLVGETTLGEVNTSFSETVSEDTVLIFPGLEHLRRTSEPIDGTGVVPDVLIEEPFSKSFTDDDPILAAGLSVLKKQLGSPPPTQPAPSEANKTLAADFSLRTKIILGVLGLLIIAFVQRRRSTPPTKQTPHAATRPPAQPAPFSGELVCEIEHGGFYDQFLLFSPDSRQIASWRPKDVKIFLVETGEEQGVATDPGKLIGFSADSKSLCTLDDNGIQEWESPDLKAGALIADPEVNKSTSGRAWTYHSLGPEHGVIRGAQSGRILNWPAGKQFYNPYGSQIAAGRMAYPSGGALTVVDLATKKSLASSPMVRGDITSVCFTTDRKRVIFGTMAGGILDFDIATKSVVQRFVVPGEIRCIDLSCDSQFAAIGCGDGCTEVHIIDLNSGTLAGSLKTEYSNTWGMAFSPDGSLLATGSDDGKLRLWKV
jgi:C-terminal processing protease CtpA/Prc